MKNIKRILKIFINAVCDTAAIYLIICLVTTLMNMIPEWVNLVVILGLTLIYEWKKSKKEEK